MERNKLLELALEELQRQKASVEQEIESLRSELRGTGFSRPAAKPAAAAPKGRKRTAAERKAHSLLMKKIWAARRAKAAKPDAVPAKEKAAKAKTKNARSRAMKEA